MTCLPGLSWEYIAWNIDLYRLVALNIEWELRPNQSMMLRSIESMITQWGRFEKKKKPEKEDLNNGVMVPLDHAKWKVISTQKIG